MNKNKLCLILRIIIKLWVIRSSPDKKLNTITISFLCLVYSYENRIDQFIQIDGKVESTLKNRRE